MKKILFLLIIIPAFSTWSQNYKKVEIFITRPDEVQELLQAGMEFDHLQMTKNNSFITFIDDQDFVILKESRFRYDILIDDWYKFYESLPQLNDYQKQSFVDESRRLYNVGGFGFGSMGGHYTLAEVILELDSMYMLYPNLITQKFQIGTTIEGRPIYAVKISDNPNISENEPRVSFSGITHAREPMGMMNLIYYMYYLLENYSTDPEAAYLVNNREIFFVPVVNPDGYEYNRSINPNGGGMWRKNRRNNGTSYGVDLNRNFGPNAYWNAPNGGSSTTPSSDTYRGTAPFSEPETQAVRDFIAGKTVKCALNYHTFGNLLIYPYGALVHETPDSLIFREYAGDMTRYNNFTAGTDMQTVGYATRGNSDDYMYDGDTVLNGGKIFAMTPEVGTDTDYFWAPQNRIFPLAQECLWMNKYYTWAAGEYVSLKDPNFDRTYFLPADTVALQPVFKNKGLSTAVNLSFEMTSLSTNAVVINGTAVMDNLTARSEGMITSQMKVYLSPLTPIDQQIKLVLTSKTGTAVMSQDTVSFIVGIPSYVFADTTNNINTHWTITSSPVTPKWAVTTAAFHSSPNSYTDSPAGIYAANATVIMTLTNAINLSSWIHPKLTYWTRYDLEAGWDYGQVEISTNNGSTWIPVAGEYMTVGSGSFQPDGQPLYNGLRTAWVREEIDLSAYNSSQFKVRFELQSDGNVQNDGWYVDDIGIFYYAAPPQYNMNLTAMIEGLYNGTTMTADTINVELRNTAPPYSLIGSRDIYINTLGAVTGTFSEALNGVPYYIVLKHRNGLETWSAAGVTFSGNTVSYDFTTSADKAFGSNQVLKGSKWCIYSGDVDQDGVIHLGDMAQIDDDIQNAITGYVPSDLNGDGIVNTADMIIAETNSSVFISAKKP